MKYRIVNNFPVHGVEFVDYTPVFSDPVELKKYIDAIKDKIKALDYKPTCILAPASRGYIIATPISLDLSIPLVPVMKTAKCAKPMLTAEYDTEYSHESMSIPEVSEDLLEHPILIDDIMAVGGTFWTTNKMIGKKITDGFFMMNLHLCNLSTMFNIFAVDEGINENNNK